MGLNTSSTVSKLLLGLLFKLLIYKMWIIILVQTGTERRLKEIIYVKYLAYSTQELKKY